MTEHTNLQKLVGNQEAFPILGRWDFFNHAGASPLPRAVAEAVRNYAAHAQTDAYLFSGWTQELEDLRVSIGKLINAHRDEIALLPNTAEGISIVAFGAIQWQPGDVIVTTGVEYPANVYAWMEVERRFGAKLVMVPEETDASGRRAVPAEKIIQAASDPRCRLVTLSHVEYASGQRHDLARIGHFCRQRGIRFCVDAIQSVGVIPVDVQAMQIDYLACGGQKWLLGPEGAGFLYCRRELIEQTRPLALGAMNVINPYRYGEYDYTLRPDAGRFECGTYPMPSLLGLKAAIELLLDVGIEPIAQRVHDLTRRLIEGITSRGYTVVSPRDGEQWSGIVSFTTAAHDPHAIVRKLRKEHRAEIVVREGRLRASPHFYNTEAQIDRLVELLPAH
ncbi:aminotransferase class V-fold PLP-dependent enzyme [Fontivita pretiosa]|uniref:aminotransferase class V-fold PLP-dependent enzyme n=1 Tax=Fontivita pretiosa TaxID=2989684 RepID=UPI003D16BB24